MPTNFAQATTVTPRAPGRFDVDLATEYAIMGTKPNGGYMLACLGRAALLAAEAAGATQRHVIAANAQFLASPDVGPAQISIEVDRVGRSASQVTALLAVAGTVGVRAQFTLGDLHAGTDPYWGASDAVPVAAIEHCVPAPMSFDRSTSLLFDPETSFEATPDGPIATGGGEFRGWLRDDHAGTFDSVGLLFASDVMPPATFGVVRTGWVPTLALTVYNRALPAPGPLRLRFRVQVIQDGFADEVLEAWDSTGRLVMQSTQLTALRLPKA